MPCFALLTCTTLRSAPLFPPPPLQAAVAEMSLMGEANRLMGQRVVELEGLLQGGRSAREVELEQELAAVSDILLHVTS